MGSGPRIHYFRDGPTPSEKGPSSQTGKKCKRYMINSMTKEDIYLNEQRQNYELILYGHGITVDEL